MKKLLITIALVSMSAFSFAETNTTDNDFTFADYEILCMKNNKEPSYEEYLYLVNNGQCILTGDNNQEKELESIMYN